MVTPEFSEFQFAYGMTRELEAGHWSIRPSGTPFFPTQPREADLGYDVRISDGIWSVFIQYKRSKKLTRSNAREWGVYNGEYYRFRVETTDDPLDPNQHERLVDLGQRYPRTYYAASQFLSWQDYVRYANTNQINSHAALLLCRTAPTPHDGETHYICHRPIDSHGLFFSETPEPKQVDALMGYDALFADLLESGPEFESFEEIEGDFRETRNHVVETGGLDIHPEEYYSEDPLEWMGHQQRFFYETLGTQLLFFTPQ